MQKQETRAIPTWQKNWHVESWGAVCQSDYGVQRPRFRGMGGLDGYSGGSVIVRLHGIGGITAGEALNPLTSPRVFFLSRFYDEESEGAASEEVRWECARRGEGGELSLIDANIQMSAVMADFESAMLCYARLLEGQGIRANAGRLSQLQGAVSSQWRTARGFAYALEEAGRELPHDEELEAWAREASSLASGFEELTREAQSACESRVAVLREKESAHNERLSLFSALLWPWAMAGGMLGMNMPNGMEASGGAIWKVATVCITLSGATWLLLRRCSL